MKTAYRTMDQVLPVKVKIPNYTLRHLGIGFYMGVWGIGLLTFGSHASEIQFRAVPDLFIFIVGSVAGWFLGSLSKP